VSVKKLKLVPDVQANGVPVYVARASSGVTGNGVVPLLLAKFVLRLVNVAVRKR